VRLRLFQEGSGREPLYHGVASNSDAKRSPRHIHQPESRTTKRAAPGHSDLRMKPAPTISASLAAIPRGGHPYGPTNSSEPRPRSRQTISKYRRLSHGTPGRDYKILSGLFAYQSDAVGKMRFGRSHEPAKPGRNVTSWEQAWLSLQQARVLRSSCSSSLSCDEPSWPLSRCQ
jgi:hypothetical protein